MERRQRCPATSPYQMPTKTSMIPETFRVLPPLSPEIPGPPPAPKPYRVAPLTVKRRDESAFVIIADSVEHKSRDPSPASGRVSPFRGHGFRESTSRHASREPSPMRQEPVVDRLPPKSHLSRSRSKLPVASKGYVSGRSSTSSSPTRNQTTSIPKPVSRRGSLSPSRAVQIINQTNSYKTSTTSPRHVQSKIPQKQTVHNSKSPLHVSKNVQSPKRVGTLHSKTNSNVITTKPPLPKVTQQRGKPADGRKTPQQPSSPKKQSLVPVPKHPATTARSPSKIPRGRNTSSGAGSNRSSSVSPSRKGTESKPLTSKPKPRLSRSPGPIRSKDSSGRPPVGRKKDADSKSATNQMQNTPDDSSAINLSGKPSVPIDKLFKREDERDNKDDDKIHKQVKESPISSEKQKSTVSSKPPSSSTSTRGRSPEKERTPNTSSSRSSSGDSKIKDTNDNQMPPRTTEAKDVINSAKSRSKHTREESDGRTDVSHEEAVKQPDTPSSDDSRSHKAKVAESNRKAEDDEDIPEPSVTLVRTTTAPALELAQPDVMPTIGAPMTAAEVHRKTEDVKPTDKETKRDEAKETGSVSSAMELARLELEDRKRLDKNAGESRKPEEQTKTDSVRDSAKREKERVSGMVETAKNGAKGTSDMSDKSKSDKESAESDVASSKGVSVESVRSTSSVETVRAVARVKATVKNLEPDDVKGSIKEEPDVEVLSANNLLKSDNNNSTRNVAWQHPSPELRQMNNSVHPVEPPTTPEQQQPRPTQPVKPKGCCGKLMDRMRCSSCCRKTPKPNSQTAASESRSVCSRLSPCCSETGCLTNLCRKLNCCKNSSCCKSNAAAAAAAGEEAVKQKQPKRPGKSRSKFRDCLSKLNCSKCCKSRQSVAAADDGDESVFEDEPQPGCCVRCKKRTKGCWSALFCLNRSCCQKLRQCIRCNRLACCRPGGCCGADLPALNRRKSRFSLNKSQSFAGLPKLDPTLVEHSSIMRGAIPVLPLPIAWLCLVFNVFLPGLGTLSSGIFCLCFGKPRFSINDTHATRFGAFCVNVVVAVSQLFTILFCLVGWGWSIWWGVIMIRLARKHRRISLAEKNAEQPVPVAVNQNHDAERGR